MFEMRQLSCTNESPGRCAGFFVGFSLNNYYQTKISAIVRFIIQMNKKNQQHHKQNPYSQIINLIHHLEKTVEELDKKTTGYKVK